MSEPIAYPGGLEGHSVRCALGYIEHARRVLELLQRQWPDTYQDGGELRRLEESLRRRLAEMVAEARLRDHLRGDEQ